MPNEFKMTPNGRVELTDEEQASLDSSRATNKVAQDAIDAKEDIRLSKRPKRSQINATVTSVANANSVAELRVAVANLMTLMDNVLAFQQVDVDEDE